MLHFAGRVLTNLLPTQQQTSTTMSWITTIEGKPDPNYKDEVPDPSIPDRMVSTKRAKQPFLSYVFPTPTNDSLLFTRSWLLVGTRNTATNRRNYTPPGASVTTHE